MTEHRIPNSRLAESSKLVMAVRHDNQKPEFKEQRMTTFGFVGQELKIGKKLPPPPVPPRRKTNCSNEVKVTACESHTFLRTTQAPTSTPKCPKSSIQASTFSREIITKVARTRTVAELAQRFLEENVRASIAPRIYPMENTTRIPKRVPTPFVFNSDVVRVRQGKTDGEEIQHSRNRQQTHPKNHIALKKLHFSSELKTKYNSFSSSTFDYENDYDYYDYGLDFLRSRPFLPINMANFGLGNYCSNAYASRSSISGGAIATAATTSSRFSLMMMGSPATSRKSSSSSGQNNDFASLLRKWSAPIPPVLSRKLGRVSDSPLGKVKVMLRVCDSGDEMSSNGILGVDQRRKQVTLIDPGGTSSSSNGGGGSGPEERRVVGVSAPKMFAFDGIFGEDDDQAEICAASAAELVASVVGGEDGCFVSLGYCTTGKKQTMFGRAVNQKMGVVPTAISWLFKSIQEQKQKTGSRFSVRVSALEVTSSSTLASGSGGSGHEVINDLLLPFVNDGEEAPSSYLLDSSSSSSKQEGCSITSSSSSSNGVRHSSFPKPQPVLNTVSEIRAPNPVAAGFFLDNAIAGMNKEDPGRHVVFTLHVYQYTIDKNGKGVVGGRSRLHCVMLGNGSPSISVLGGLLLAVLNGQRHLPSRESKVGAILRECLGSLTCRAVIMIHVGHRRKCSCSGNSDSKNDECDNLETSRVGYMSNIRSRYAETLAALQLGSRVHRLRRSRRLKMGSVGSGNGSGGSSGGSGEEMRNGVGNGITSSPGIEGGETGSSDIDPSSSDLSCDTVIYLGPTIDEATDGEHPPIYLPSLDGDENGVDHKMFPTRSSHNSLTSGNHNHNGGGGGTLTKSKSPKPKPLVVKQSEEQWVDGPKLSKPQSANHRTAGGPITSSSPLNNDSTNLTKKSETWIDGPAASRVSHQGNNFPSPKKMPSQHHHSNNNNKMRLDSSGGSCSISSMKVQMIQQWISNQSSHCTNNGLDHTHHYPDSVTSSHMGSSDYDILPYNNHKMILHPQYMYSPYLNGLNSDHYHYNNTSNGGCVEPEYKSLTVFKTCGGDLDDEQEHGADCPSNGYEFEYIEVVEPDVPVPTRDACLQVTEEDIAMSFLEENPLPESDQNFTMGVDAYFFSNGNTAGSSSGKINGREGVMITNNHHSTSHYVSNHPPVTTAGGIGGGSLANNNNNKVQLSPPLPTSSLLLDSCSQELNYHTLEKQQQQHQQLQRQPYDSSVSSAASTCTSLTDKGDGYHPLRVLSQECLTVVSTFADSVAANDEEIDRLWPRFSFPNDLAMLSQQEHSSGSGICNGLCKNLVSLSQMSLTHNGCTNNYTGSAGNSNEQSSIPKTSLNLQSNGENSVNKPIIHKTVKIPNPPPDLSDESIFKIPGNPVFVKIRKMKSEASDTEEEASSTTGRIPPMKLLDLTPIKNNLVEDNNGSTKGDASTGAKQVIVRSTLLKQQPQQQQHGCDHKHHQNHYGPTTANNNNNNNNINGLNCNGESSLPRPIIATSCKDNNEATPPTSPNPLTEAVISFPKSPSKSKSRKIAKFFRSSRSKSPKKTNAVLSNSNGVVTSSSESGKSSSASTISAETAKSSSSDSSTGLGSSFPTKSPKHQSPNRRSSASLKNPALLLQATSHPTSDYHFITCDNNSSSAGLPTFLPSPTRAGTGKKTEMPETKI